MFRTKWKELDLTEDDLKRLQEEILQDPKVGAVMQGTGRAGKTRFAFEHRGKSGSIRIIYVDFEVYEKVYLITAYPKSVKDNLPQSERNEIKHLIAILEEQLKENDGGKMQ